MPHDRIDRLDPVTSTRKEIAMAIQHPPAPPRARRALLLALAVAALLAVVPAWRPLAAAGAAAPTTSDGRSTSSNGRANAANGASESSWLALQATTVKPESSALR